MNVKIKLKPTFKSEKSERNCKFCMTFWCMLVMFLSVNSLADEIVFKFKSPSFSGINTSSHYLTIQNQEFNRKQALCCRDKSFTRPDRKRQRKHNTCKVYKELRV